MMPKEILFVSHKITGDHNLICSCGRPATVVIERGPKIFPACEHDLGMAAVGNMRLSNTQLIYSQKQQRFSNIIYLN